MDTRSQANFLARCAVLAIVTEPLANKQGCTTRTVDSSPNAKLEYFLISGVNIYGDLHSLALDVLTCERPARIFMHARNAQASSVKNRNGGKVSFGQVWLLTPIIAAHAKLLRSGIINPDPESVVATALDLLDLTSEGDVADLEDFCQLSIEQSRIANERRGISRTYPNPRFKGRFSTVREALNEPALTSLSITQEIKQGYPITLGLWHEWNNSEESDLLAFTERSFPCLLDRFGRYDIPADLLAAAMYFALATAGPEVVFP